MRETEDDTKKCKDIPYPWIKRINIVKMAIIPKSTDLMQFLSKYSQHFSQNWTILKFIRKQKSWIAKPTHGSVEENSEPVSKHSTYGELTYDQEGRL